MKKILYCSAALIMMALLVSCPIPDGEKTVDEGARRIYVDVYAMVPEKGKADTATSLEVTTSFLRGGRAASETKTVVVTDANRSNVCLGSYNLEEERTMNVRIKVYDGEGRILSEGNRMVVGVPVEREVSLLDDSMIVLYVKNPDPAYGVASYMLNLTYETEGELFTDKGMGMDEDGPYLTAEYTMVYAFPRSILREKNIRYVLEAYSRGGSYRGGFGSEGILTVDDNENGYILDPPSFGDTAVPVKIDVTRFEKGQMLDISFGGPGSNLIKGIFEVLSDDELIILYSSTATLLDGIEQSELRMYVQPLDSEGNPQGDKLILRLKDPASGPITGSKSVYETEGTTR